MYSLDNVSFSYPGKDVLKSISFNVERGSVVGILGSNGAGKTTLFKLLNRRNKIGSGQLTLDGVDINSYTPRDLSRSVALVPQNPESNFPFTARELIEMGRRPYRGLFGGGNHSERALIDSVIEQTGLLHLQNRNVTQLSGGERQLVFLARAFAQQPDVLLLDEATSSLDINHTLDIFSLVRRKVKEESLTVVAVIHDINLAAIFCDQIVFINDGCSIGPGSPRDMIQSSTLEQVYGVDSEMIHVHSEPLHVNYSIG